MSGADNGLSLFGTEDDQEQSGADDAVFFSWDGEQVDYSDAMLTRGRSYGSYVNTARALPDVRDGLKPVQRRIIVAMDDLGVRSDRKYSKSAKTVGHVIGTYHPHGDTAVYDAMVRMAQPWQSNLPLIDGQGNWGNLHNEAPAAAQRYTECRLSPASTEFLTDLRPEVVAYEANFDETKQMPKVLPVTFPNLLVNGSMGVGWAMACSVPPHNTAEVINAALLVLDDPDVAIERLLKVMPGPDLPGGGILVNPENLASIYESGRGTVMVQGRIEQLPGQQVLRITELPYQVSAKSIVEQAVEGAKAGKITEIYTAELPKNLTDASGVDVQVKCKRGGSVQRLMHELVEHTKLRDTLAFNFTVLVDNVPQTLSLRQILICFLDFRKEVVARRLAHELEVLRRRLHLLLAEQSAADVIDRVVAIIRTARDDDDSKAKLMAQLRYVPHGTSKPVPIDEVQAEHILDMALKRINTLNRFRINEEIQQKGARADEITAILGSADGVTNIVREELKDVRKRFGRPRRTVVSAETTNATGEILSANGRPKTVVLASAPSEDVWAYVTSDGAVLVTPRTARAPSSAPVKLAGSSSLVAVTATRSDQRLLIFTEQGQAVRATLSDQPAGRTGPGRPLLSLLGQDAVAAVFSGDDAPYYLLVSARGQVKRVPATTIANASTAGTVCCRVPEDDRIVAVVPHESDDEILIGKAGGQVLRLETGAKLRPVPTGAAGMVAGAKVDAGDRVVSAVKAEGTSLLNLHASGMALAVLLNEYPVKGRGSGGVQSVLVDRPAKSPAGELALVVCQGPTSEIELFTDRGGVHRAAPGDNPLARRATNSRPFLPLGPGEAPRGQVHWAVK
ncbi:MAG: DNA gyrase subunit A [Acidimicrobiales bacterium]